MVVHGRVQGVGFRWFVREQARRLDLAGTVRNETDGTVHVEAEGPAHAIAQLRDRLRAGPPGAEVLRIEERTPGATALSRPFAILRG